MQYTNPNAGSSAAELTVTMLWMESTRLGTAARTHMDGTRQRLATAGIHVREELTDDGAGGGRIRRLVSLVRAGRRAAHAGIVVARWHPFLAFVTPSWLRKGGRVLLLVQGNDESTYEANPWLRRVPGIRWIMQRSLRSASSILTVNVGLADWVNQVRAHDPVIPIDVMPSGVSDVFFNAPSPQEPNDYALFFGGLAPWQGVDYMLSAYRDPLWPSGLRLLVIGDGVMAQEVRMAEDEYLRWLGPMRPEEVARHVAGALCTLCPKSNTGSMATATTPFKILESVAAGVPVIATDIPAQIAMLAEGYGVLVDGNDPSDLARAVATLRSDRKQREALAARAREVAPRYRWNFAAPQLAEAISALESSIRSRSGRGASGVGW